MDGLRLAISAGMDNWVERALPYWSILLNVLLSLALFPEAEPAARLGRYASALATLVFGAS